MDLHVFWFFLLGVLLAGYAVLDGFDLGVGILHPLVRGDRERRLVLNSIGPLWDGNEVWLVTFGGALFAAFPEAYATILSGFYLPFMVLLVALIGRAISIEFRSKVKHRAWRAYWDASFSLSSLVVVSLFGVLAGNMIQGIPVDGSREYVGGVVELFGLYPVTVGALAVAAAAMHGAFYLHLKTEGALQARVSTWRWPAYGLFLIAYLLVTIMTLVRVPRAVQGFERWPLAWGVVVLTVLAVASIPRALVREQPGLAFAGSSATILALVFNLGMALFPNVVVSSIAPEHGLDIYEAASSESTLALMRTIALLGLPFVLTYTGIVYWVFRGKVRLDDSSY